MYGAPTLSFPLQSMLTCKIEPYLIYGLQSDYSSTTGLSRMHYSIGLSLALIK
jgi:hypothetical protein